MANTADASSGAAANGTQASIEAKSLVNGTNFTLGLDNVLWCIY